MSESSAVLEFLSLQKRFDAVGLTLTVKEHSFQVCDAPNSNGIIAFTMLSEASRFIRGYELGYASSLTPIAK